MIISSKRFPIHALILQSMRTAAADLGRHPLSNQSFHEGRFVEGPVILVGHRSVHIALKEREHGEPNARPPAMLVGTGVGQRVVVEEEAGGDVEGDEHID